MERYSLNEFCVKNVAPVHTFTCDSINTVKQTWINILYLLKRDWYCDSNSSKIDRLASSTWISLASVATLLMDSENEKES